MANHGDSLSLQWVRGEIQETLKQSQQALEAFAENREDHSRLRFCLNHLHQVHGTLKMVELEGRPWSPPRWKPWPKPCSTIPRGHRQGHQQSDAGHTATPRVPLRIARERR